MLLLCWLFPQGNGAQILPERISKIYSLFLNAFLSCNVLLISIPLYILILLLSIILDRNAPLFPFCITRIWDLASSMVGYMTDRSKSFFWKIRFRCVWQHQGLVVESSEFRYYRHHIHQQVCNVYELGGCKFRQKDFC